MTSKGFFLLSIFAPEWPEVYASRCQAGLLYRLPLEPEVDAAERRYLRLRRHFETVRGFPEVKLIAKAILKKAEGNRASVWCHLEAVYISPAGQCTPS